jgi:hypothetical protein
MSAEKLLGLIRRTVSQYIQLLPRNSEVFPGCQVSEIVTQAQNDWFMSRELPESYDAGVQHFSPKSVSWARSVLADGGEGMVLPTIEQAITYIDLFDIQFPILTRFTVTAADVHGINKAGNTGAVIALPKSMSINGSRTQVVFDLESTNCGVFGVAFDD